MTIILVTHDVALAANVDRTIAIPDGRTSIETVRREAQRILYRRFLVGHIWQQSGTLVFILLRLRCLPLGIATSLLA
ncbi:MAG: hypothetical protein E6J22_20060 [Chloroflexi bacterium]|nr:MAG: hypothetical protein E6J22_20060 [Chloroflexota bacterium]